MAVVYRGSLRLWRRWCRDGLRKLAGSISIALCGLMLAGLPVWADILPQPPANSDLAFRILPHRPNQFSLEPEVMREQPLVRLVAEAAARYLGFDPLTEVGEAFEGTLVGAILSDPKRGSSLVAYFKDRELRSQRELVVNEMQGLASDLESYQEENESYPDDFKNYIEEVRYYEPSLPEGVTYEYQRTGGGKGFRLLVRYADPSRLGQLGPAPVLGSDGLTEHLTVEAPALPLNFVLSAKVANAELAKTLTTRMLGEPRGGFWISDAEPPLVATLRGSWMVLTDRKENIGPCLKTLNGQAPGLQKNLGFQVVARNIDMNAPAILYVDLPRILQGLADSPEEVQMLRLLGPAGYAITPQEHSQLRTEAFVSIESPKGSELARLLHGSANANPESAMVASNIPWDVSNTFAIDYRRSKKLFDALVALSPEAKESMDLAEDVWAGFLGLDAEAGFDQIMEGWAIVSFERLDIFVNALEGFTEAMDVIDSAVPDFQGTGGPVSDSVEPAVSDGDTITTADEAAAGPSSAPASPKVTVDEPAMNDPDDGVEIDPEIESDAVITAPAPAKPARLPFTVAFQVPDAQARAAVITALTKQIGDDSRTTTVNGVEVVGRQDGLLSYALCNNWFYVCGGKTQRLLRNFLAAATGRKESLTSLDTWARFRHGQRGQVIMIGHQKVDAFYSVIKGFLLFLGPDFRPLAKELGGLRDYHSAGFIVPDGLLLVGDVLQGDGK